MLFVHRRRKSAGAAAAAICLGLAALAAGCGDDEEDTAASTPPASATATPGAEGELDGSGMKIAFLTFMFGNTTSDAGVSGAKEYAESIGAEITPFDGKFNPGAQIKQCTDAINSGQYDAVVFGVIAGPAAVPCARLAEQKGVPLVSWGSAVGTDYKADEATVPGVTTQVHVPLFDLEGALAEEVERACEDLDPCRIVELSVLQAIPDIENAFQENLKPILEANPNMEIVANPEGGFDAGGGQKAMQDVLSKGTEFDVLVSAGSQPIKGARIALANAGKKLGTGEGEIRVVSSGGEVDQIARVRSGDYFATIPVLPKTMGAKAVEFAVRAAKGETLEKGYNPNELAGVPLKFTQENAGEYPDFKGEYN